MSHPTINGQPVTKLRLTVGATGPWFADVDLDDDAGALSGRVSITFGGRTYLGTVTEQGVLGTRRARVVAGGAGWGRTLAPRAYHNDAQVKALNVAQDAAREAGETLGAFVPSSLTVGVDYARQSGPASRALEDVIGSASWWVGADGVTVVGTRSSSPAAPGSYDVVDIDARSKIVTLRVEDVSAVDVGSVIQVGGESLTVRDLEIIVEPDSTELRAWCGEPNALAGLLRRIVARATDGQLFGVYRYRVVTMAVDRVNLQAVRKLPGLPDLASVSMWPGVAGAHATLTPGAEVLVQFLEGDRAQPVITGFVGKGGPGFGPVSLDLGGVGALPVAIAELVEAAIYAAIAGHTHNDPVSGATGTGIISPGTVPSTSAAIVRAL